MTYAAGHELKFAKISAADSGTNTIVAAVSGQKIKVCSYVIVAAGAVNAKWMSGASDLSGLLTLGTNSGVSCPAAGEAVLLETVAGSALILNLSGSVLVGGHLTYLTEEH